MIQYAKWYIYVYSILFMIVYIYILLEMFLDILKNIIQSSVRIDRFTLTNTIKMIDYRSGRRLIRQKPTYVTKVYV